MNSHEAWQRAKQCFPGGVNSPVRAFRSVGMDPIFIKSAYGCYITDIEGNKYVDYVGSWGPMILGHANEEVIEAVKKAAENSLSFGAPTLGETELAELIKTAFPHMERMRFVSSGTEATMSAIRIARGFTNKPYIIKIDGGYHGHSDSLLVSAGSGVATFAIPGCPGIPDSIAANTLVVPFGNSEAIKQCFEKYENKIACVIVEPVCGNMGVVLPTKEYLNDLRKYCTDNGSILIFDEVMTGFRACFGGVGQLYGITPDMTCLGKIVGGGMPLAVYGGKQEIMQCVAPDGPVYQAGTLSGNPVAVAAGLTTLKIIKRDKNFYKNLEKKSSQIIKAMSETASNYNFDVVCNSCLSMFTMFFQSEEVNNYDDAKKSNTEIYAKFFRGMIKEGIYIAPSQFEANFVSIKHDDQAIEKTQIALNKVFSSL